MVKKMENSYLVENVPSLGSCLYHIAPTGNCSTTVLLRLCLTRFVDQPSTLLKITLIVHAHVVEHVYLLCSMYKMSNFSCLYIRVFCYITGVREAILTVDLFTFTVWGSKDLQPYH